MSETSAGNLTPYEFTITNTCDIFTSYVGQLEMSSSSTLPTKYIRAMVNNEQILNLNEYEESTDYVNSNNLIIEEFSCRGDVCN